MALSIANPLFIFRSNKISLTQENAIYLVGISFRKHLKLSSIKVTFSEVQKESSHLVDNN